MNLESGGVLDRELPELLDLYRHLNPDVPMLQIDKRILEVWRAILDNPAFHMLVSRSDGRVVCTCMLSVVPNLTRGARPYGLIENVVTHPDYRGRGIATKLLSLALATAWEFQCYKVMLLTGTKREAKLKFYENAGFVRGDKTGFVARPPSATTSPNQHD